MASVEIILGYFVTGIIWGSTNAFMEVGSKEEDEPKSKVTESAEDSTTTNAKKSNELKEGVKMFTKCAFVIPFLVNQAASIFNNFLVAKSDLSIAVPIVNCITFMATFVTARILT